MGVSTRDFERLCRNLGLDPVSRIGQMEGAPPKNGNKLNARKKSTPDGEVFDSGEEAKRWIELRVMEKSGQIRNLRRQVQFLLQPKFRDPHSHKAVRAITYRPDFVYEERWVVGELQRGEIWRQVAEDVKAKAKKPKGIRATRTEGYSLRRRLFQAKYPDIEFREV